MRLFHSSLYAAALLACLALIPLARTSVRGAHGRTWLTTFLVIQSSGFLLEWLILHPATPAKSLWLALLMMLAFLLAPCLWLCALELTESRSPRWRGLPASHLAPVVCGIVMLLPLAAAAHGGTRFIPEVAQPMTWHAHLIHEGMLAAIVLFGLQAAFYFRECLRILVRHSRQTKALFSSLENSSLNTLRALILILATHAVVGVGRGLYGFLMGQEAGPNASFALLETAVIAWAVFTLPRARAAVEADALDRDVVTEKYARSALDDTARARIRRKLDDAFVNRALHRDVRLTLRALCAELRENPHYVSQVINQDLGSTFYDLVNRHRVNDAMTILVRDPGASVLQVAGVVGFNSRSTFNAAFRAHAGTTPSAYRAARMSSPAGSDA